MTESIKILSHGEMIFGRRGSFVVRLIYAIFGLALTLFFRRIELVGSEKLPEKSGLIFVSNHPNALIDPALVFIALPRKISFLAKSTLFKIPVLGLLVRAVGALPLYRQQDAGADLSKNQETFKIAREILKNGGSIALFPEGVSHNAPDLKPLKTGAARIALGAVSVGKNPDSLNLQIVPIGLFYTNKTMFRSDALLYFGEPFAVAPAELDESGQPARAAVKSLTEQIETALRSVTLNAESEMKLTTARIAEDVFTSTTPHKENLAERLTFLRKFVDAEEDRILEQALAEYEKKIAAHGVESEFLAVSQYSKFFIFREALKRLANLLIFAPMALVGIIIHFPAYQLCRLLAYTQTKRGDFDMASTVKVLAAIVLMPLTWTFTAFAAYFFVGWKLVVPATLLTILSGYTALETLEKIEESRNWAKAILLYTRRREKFLRLLAERRRLFEKIGGGEKMENKKAKP